MKKGKRILAIFGIIFLLLIYLLTLVFALIDASDTMVMFKVCILSTVLFPVLLWLYTFIFRLVASQPKTPSFDEEEDNEEKSE